MNNTVGITFVCGEKGEMLTSKRPQGQFLSAFGCLPAAVRATSTLKLNDYPSHKSKPEEYFSFFGANTQNCWSRFFVGGLTLTDPMFTLSYLIKLMFEMYQDHKMTSSKLGNGMFFFSHVFLYCGNIFTLTNWTFLAIGNRTFRSSTCGQTGRLLSHGIIQLIQLFRSFCE